MLQDTTFNQMFDIAQLVPAQYAAYRPLLTDGLYFFLQHLSAHRLAAITTEQLAMPEKTSLLDRTIALIRHCPTLHKLGQVVARDRRLSLDLRKRLQQLESLRPTTPLSAIRKIIHRELGSPPGLTIASHALAEASVAMAVPFSWCESGSRTPHHGIFKVLKPGVEERLREELSIWSALGAFLAQRCEHYDLPVLDYADTLDGVRKLLVNEIHLEREQEHLAQAAQFYDDYPQVVIPRLLPFCSANITAMERINGRKVTDAERSAYQRQRLATTVFDALVAKPFWSDGPTTTFHADPHAGNLFLADDGRLAILDWSLVARLDKIQRVAVVQIVLGALTLDESHICRTVATLARKPPAESLLRATVGDALRQVTRGTFPGFDWVLGLLDRLATSTNLGFSEDLIMFRKALLTLTGVIADISTQCSTEGVLISSAMRQFQRELASRPFVSVDSRDFGSHVSNMDLCHLWYTLPLTVTRYWLKNCQYYLENLTAKGDYVH
jgi:ubiquinone biosynthesis protein